MFSGNPSLNSGLNRLFLATILLSCPLILASENLDEIDLDFRSADDVNEGALVFLSSADHRSLLKSSSTFILTQTSIDTGWVDLEQCYHQLDPVPDMEIVYQYKHMKDLRISRSKHIAQVEISGQSAILKQVGKGAEICVRSQVKNLYRKPDRSLSLVNGPYHRRFLDGYYPYQLILKVKYNSRQLRLLHTKPEPQAGFRVRVTEGLVEINTLFEGQLNTELVFVEK